MLESLTSRRTLLLGALSLTGGAVSACSPGRGTARPGPTSSTSPATVAPTTTPTTLPIAPSTTIAPFNPATPYITPNDRFYRIDTTIETPQVDAATWSMTVEGLVDRPLTLSYADLLARPQVTRTITLACVSNYVGGLLVGTAEWEGVLLADVLREAGVQDSAEQVFSTSVDGWTCGFPIAAALDGRDALIALRMNGEPLPAEHGYPVRLVVPGLYGYVSATKWLSSIRLTTWEEESFWIRVGWSREGPIKTQCRIDLPRAGTEIDAGPTMIAGVAWAPHTGVAKVEVQIDSGEWVEAELGDEDLDDAWRLWRFPWTATPGSHLLRARTTDKTGVTQTEEPTPPEPDGATGYPTRGFRVVDRTAR